MPKSSVVIFKADLSALPPLLISKNVLTCLSGTVKLRRSRQGVPLLRLLDNLDTSTDQYIFAHERHIILQNGNSKISFEQHPLLINHFGLMCNFQNSEF